MTTELKEKTFNWAKIGVMVTGFVGLATIYQNNERDRKSSEKEWRKEMRDKLDKTSNTITETATKLDCHIASDAKESELVWQKLEK